MANDQLKFTADPYLRERLEKEQRRRRQPTLSQTIRDLQVERLTQIETADASAPAQQAPDANTQPAASVQR